MIFSNAALYNTVVASPAPATAPATRPAIVVPLTATTPGSLNVRDFGAKGDGVTDDTDAIQRCLLHVAAKPKSYVAPEVFFPKGLYLVSRTLLLSNCVNGVYLDINLRGQEATLKQIHPETDILYVRHAWRNLIEGITFDGGNRQLKVWTKNRDAGHIIIRDCIFKNASSYAIDDQIRKRLSTTNPYENLSDMVEPYAVSTDAQGLPLLTPVDESVLPYLPFGSSVVRINRCSFERCMNVLSGCSDWILMDDCTIQTHPQMRGPAILSGGHLLMENVTGLAHPTPGLEQCWIEKIVDGQEDGIDLKNVILKTDSKEGLCVIRNDYQFAGGRHVSLIADSCDFQSAGCKENCLFYLKEVPNLINVRNCREISAPAPGSVSQRDVAIVGFEKPLGEEYFHFHSPEVFSYSLDENNLHLNASLPDPMMRFVDKPLPQKVARFFSQTPPPLNLRQMRQGVTLQLNLKNFGAMGTGATDDSAAIQKAVDSAKNCTEFVEVIVPSGLYRIDTTVELPPQIVLRGCGQSAFMAPAGKSHVIFSIADAEHIVLQNLQFNSCEQAIAIHTKATGKREILIDNCDFDRNRDWAVTGLSGSGAIDEPNQTALQMSDCTFIYSRVLKHNAQYALIENPWITTDPDMLNSGAIVNMGTLHLKSLCGVPQTTSANKSSGKNKIDTRNNDMRWIDNYAQVFADRCRFGGESGGLPAVVNFTTTGSVLIQNSWLENYQGNPKRVTVVDCEQMPEWIALRGNMGWPAPQVMVTLRSTAMGNLHSRFFESGNTAPAWIKDERKSGK